ncbi:MAG: adenylate/guanylate cyclase domain-containing protein [Acidimicrobiales bacterium]
MLTLEEATEQSGLSELDLVRLTRAAGFADPDPGARVLTERFVALAAGMSAVATIFGEDAGYQLLRVLGSSMARVADAVISAFLVNVEPAAQREDPSGLAVARANVEAASLLPFVAATLDALFRQHLLSAQRVAGSSGADLVGFETQHLVVGFVDLVGFTELGEELSVRDLGAMLSNYERLAADAVTAGGGRVIKLIGDEIMYTAPHAVLACTIAVDPVEALRQHAAIPPVRAGLAGGQVILRDGDVFGPIVNLAARVVKVARPGEVVVTTDVASEAGWAGEARGAHTLKGIEGSVELCRLLPR